MSIHDDAWRRSHDLAWIPGLIVWRDDPRGPDAPMDADPQLVMRQQLAARAQIRKAWGIYSALPLPEALWEFHAAIARLEEWT